jgi:hypothetical protein
MVHLEYGGEMLAFLLDIAELPEVYYSYYNNLSLLIFFQSHTGVAMANAFQAMLKQSGLSKKILAINADNATSNDTQTTKLDELDNSFDEENRVRCFNHTLQLSAKSLLKPFNTALSGTTTDNNNDNVASQDDNPAQVVEDDSEEEGTDEDKESSVDLEGDVEDDNVDELQELTEEEQRKVLEETTIVRETITKVCHLNAHIMYY